MKTQFTLAARGIGRFRRITVSAAQKIKASRSPSSPRNSPLSGENNCPSIATDYSEALHSEILEAVDREYVHTRGAREQFSKERGNTDGYL